MTEAEFHGKRRMFAVKDGHIVIAPQGFPYSHFEWFCGLFGLEAAREWQRRATRGYYLDARVVAYVGEDFKAMGCDYAGMLDVCKAFAALTGKPVEEVGAGAHPGKEQPWLPRSLYPYEEFSTIVNGLLEKKRAGT